MVCNGYAEDVSSPSFCLRSTDTWFESTLLFYFYQLSENELEENILLNLHKKKWIDGLTLQCFDSHAKANEQIVQEMLDLAVKYNKAIQEEDWLPPEKLVIGNAGREDAKKDLEEHVVNFIS
ncbi:hypothetical protein SUGI_0908880 [Cryptomeria japonica]|nr:hypothetical protein SUGI_0908880 [Cryptomeria japonica]